MQEVPFMRIFDVLIMKKIAVIIDETLASGIALNSTAHTLMSLGSRVSEVMGKDVIDASGDRHFGIPICPNVVLKANKNQIKEIIESSRVSPDLVVVDYPSHGFTTSTDDEYVEAVSKETKETIAYYCVAIYGDTKKVRKLTKHLSLWR